MLLALPVNTCHHPNMAFVVEVMAKFYAKPKDVHYNVVRRIMRYM
jgi:hypothetical protein